MRPTGNVTVVELGVVARYAIMPSTPNSNALPSWAELGDAKTSMTNPVVRARSMANAPRKRAHVDVAQNGTACLSPASAETSGGGRLADDRDLDEKRGWTSDDCTRSRTLALRDHPSDRSGRAPRFRLQ